MTNKPSQIDLARDLLARERVGNKLVSVTFIKKDGTERVMVTNRAAEPSRIKGTARGQAWAQTMDERHPHLIRVAEIRKPSKVLADCRELRAQGLDATAIAAKVQTVQWRSIDLRTIKQIKADGITHTFG